MRSEGNERDKLGERIDRGSGSGTGIKSVHDIEERDDMRERR